MIFTSSLLILLISSTIIQSAFYLISIFYWIRNPVVVNKAESLEPISIIIAAHNELENLKILIPHLVKQEYPIFEIIIALDRCTDESIQYVSTMSDEYELLNFVVIEETPDNLSPKKHALTQAIKTAKHEILALTDADCIPQSKEWLQYVHQPFQSGKEIAIGYSPYFKISGLLNRFIRYETIQTAIQYLTAAMSGHTYMAVGRNMSYKRNLFLTADGFGKHKEILSGDDDLLISTIANPNNVGIYIHQNSHIYTHPVKSWKDFFKQKKRHLSVGKYYKQSHQIILTMLGASQIIFWLTFIILAILKTNLPLLVLCFAIRVPLQHAFFIKGIREIGDNFEYFWILFLDLVHTLYLLVMGPIGFFTKKVKWN